MGLGRRSDDSSRLQKEHKYSMTVNACTLVLLMMQYDGDSIKSRQVKTHLAFHNGKVRLLRSKSANYRSMEQTDWRTPHLGPSSSWQLHIEWQLHRYWKLSGPGGSSWMCQPWWPAHDTMRSAGLLTFWKFEIKREKTIKKSPSNFVMLLWSG